MKARPITIFADAHGSTRGGICRVPLSRDGKHEAIVSLDDYEYLVSLGVSPNWQLSGGSVVAKASRRVSEDSRLILIGRVLMGAEAGQQVRFKDGNRLNLRRDNMTIRQGGFSLRNDREELERHREDRTEG